jgi:maltooligosyltrehalose trehalohydrolase
MQPPAWPLGASFEGDSLRFRYWAPEHRKVEVELLGEARRTLALERQDDGTFVGALEQAPERVRYRVGVDGAGPFPDPFSRAQPDGVHAASEIARDTFLWTDHAWRGVALEDLVLMEIHVGTATPEGTFEALIGKLPHYRELGVTALELMPVASFPGTRNWGYDGVSLFAPAAVHGGPEGLRRLVAAAHEEELGVLLDVVYNHFGPDGNYLASYSRRHFTADRKTPWGDAIDTREEPVRELFRQNAAMWIRDYHLDGLRLDATHEILDDRARPLLKEIAEAARAAAPEREVLVIAEDDRNEARLVRSTEKQGDGLDAVWADDFHHQVRRAFAGDRDGYFADFSGTAADLATTIERGWFYEGQPSAHRGGPRGTPAAQVHPTRLVHCLQNHDQVGNRALGDRLGASVSDAAQRAMVALLLLSPSTPLLFQGQEWNASTPFLYFTDHAAELGRAVTAGRRREFAGFTAFTAAEIPDPQDLTTFQRSKLDWTELGRGRHAAMLSWYRALLRLRRTHPALRARDRGSFRASALGEDALVLERRGGGHTLQLIAALRGVVDLPLDPAWEVLLASGDARHGGAGEARVIAGRLVIEGPGAVVVVRRERAPAVTSRSNPGA